MENSKPEKAEVCQLVPQFDEEKKVNHSTILSRIVFAALANVLLIINPCMGQIVCPTHHGDLTYHDGNIYVAVNLVEFNKERA